MAKTASTTRPKPAVGISELLQWRSRRGAVLLIATALVLGVFGTVSASALKALQFQSDGGLQTLAVVVPAMVVSYLALYVLVSAMIALIAGGRAPNDAVSRSGTRRMGFRRREDYILVALWLCLLVPAIAATAILLADVLHVQSATDRNAIGYAVVQGLAVMVHACRRFLARSIEPSAHA